MFKIIYVNHTCKIMHVCIGHEEIAKIQDKAQQMQKLQETFNYFLKDICSLWDSWISPKRGGGFQISAAQARHGWKFIFNLTKIAINESTQEANDTVYYLKSLIHAWRLEATTEELDNCVENGAGMYLNLYSKLIAAKDSNQEAWRVKILEVAVKTGMSLLKQLLEEELNLHTDLARTGQHKMMDTHRISEKTLKLVLGAIIKMMKPSTHKNKENRKYNKFFKHAAEACGQVLQCLRNLSSAAPASAAASHADGEVLASWEEDLKTRVQEIANGSQPDQLVTALGGICRGYTRAGKLFYKHVLPHLNMHGLLLNCVQEVLISYSASLIQDIQAAKDDEQVIDACEQRGEDLLTHLLPNLASWLNRPDAKTQKLTLQLLTGRDAASFNTQPPATLHTRDPASSNPARGILEFMDKDIFVNDNTRVGSGGGGGERGSGLMACIRQMWPTFSSSNCVSELRQAFYYLLQDVNDLKRYWPAYILDELRSILVVGLSDSHEGVRQSVFEWWHSQGLEQHPAERFSKLFSMLPPPERALDEQWLGNSVSLLLQLSRDSKCDSAKIFDQDLNVNRDIFKNNITFAKRQISTVSLAAGSLPMATPMFASSLPFSQQQASLTLSSQSISSQAGGGGGDVMATMQGGSQESGGGGASMTLDSTRDYLAQQTLQANDTSLFVPRRKDLARPAPGGGGWGGMRKMGAFAMPRPKSAISKVSSDDAERTRMARMAEARRDASQRSKVYVCLYGCTCACMYVYKSVFMHACMHTHARTHARTHVWMHVCMHACMYVCIRQRMTCWSVADEQQEGDDGARVPRRRDPRHSNHAE
jgi:hypothetical protein